MLKDGGCSWEWRVKRWGLSCPVRKVRLLLCLCFCPLALLLSSFLLETSCHGCRDALVPRGLLIHHWSKKEQSVSRPSVELFLLLRARKCECLCRGGKINPRAHEGREEEKLHNLHRQKSSSYLAGERKEDAEEASDAMLDAGKCNCRSCNRSGHVNPAPFALSAPFAPPAKYEREAEWSYSTCHYDQSHLSTPLGTWFPLHGQPGILGIWETRRDRHRESREKEERESEGERKREWERKTWVCVCSFRTIWLIFSLCHLVT